MGNRVTVYLSADNIISSLGFTTEDNLRAIRSYRSGISLQAGKQLADTPIMAACVDSRSLAEQVRQHRLESFTRIEQLFILSITEVVKQSGVQPGDPGTCILFASTKGNIDRLAHHTSCPPVEISLWETARKVSSHFHTNVDFRVLSNACISGLSALIVAKRLLESGAYKSVIVTGADVLSHFITSGFISFKSVSSDRCRPYDEKRDGLNLGEGCGTILLTTKGAPGNIVLSGGSITNDANHISGPSRTGDGLYYAIRHAMSEANITPTDVDFVNAHGTATVYNDEMEAKAIHLAGLQNSPLGSLKSYFGHTLGAAGIIETIVCAHQLKNNILYGTLGFGEPGVSMPVRVTAKHREAPLNTCVKTASGFGGCNAVIVLTSLPAALPGNDGVASKVETVSEVRIRGSQITVNDRLVLSSPGEPFASFIRLAYKDLGESNMKFYKMDDLSKLGYIAACYLLNGLSFAPGEAGLILSNANSSLDTDIKHQQLIDKGGDEAASPAVFVYTLPNVVAGEICIRHKIQGENTFFIQKACNLAALEEYARLVIGVSNLKYCIVGWCELLGEDYEATFKLLEQK